MNFFLPNIWPTYRFNKGKEEGLLNQVINDDKKGVKGINFLLAQARTVFSVSKKKRWRVVQVTGILSEALNLLSSQVIKCLLLLCVSGLWTSLSWLWCFGFRLKPIFVTAQAASKILLGSKVDKNDKNINQLAYMLCKSNQILHYNNLNVCHTMYVPYKM